MLKLMLLSRTVFSLTREMYLAGCELHIQTVSLLIVLTLKRWGGRGEVGGDGFKPFWLCCTFNDTTQG